jgi:hypothetical protein
VGPTDIHGGFGWAPSEENPADDPTRKKKIRDPIPVGNDVAVLVAREAARWPRLKKAYRERNAGLEGAGVGSPGQLVVALLGRWGTELRSEFKKARGVLWDEDGVVGVATETRLGPGEDLVTPAPSSLEKARRSLSQGRIGLLLVSLVPSEASGTPWYRRGSEEGTAWLDLVEECEKGGNLVGGSGAQGLGMEEAPEAPEAPRLAGALHGRSLGLRGRGPLLEVRDLVWECPVPQAVERLVRLR